MKTAFNLAILLAGVPCLLASLAGCIAGPSELNNELSTGNGDRRRDPYLPESFKPDLGRTTPETEAPAPSVVAIDRTNWEIMRVTVPNDLAAHQPIYTRSLHENDEIARNRGLYPTAVSANQVTHPTSHDAQLLEAAEAPFAAAADILLFIPRAVMNPPWETVRTGTEPYRRVPAPRASVPQVVSTPTTKPATTRAGIPDPAAAPVAVPIGEYLPAAPAPGTTPPQ
jgi:hypothetical protein